MNTKLIIPKKRKVTKPEDLSPRIKRLRGIIKVEEDLDYKQILKEELIEQYYNK